MSRIRTSVAGFFQAPPLEGDERRTFRRHMAFALLAAAAAGLLSTAPTIALKALAGPKWILNFRLMFSSLGMFCTLYLGSWMSHRRKMPFIRIPGIAFAVCSLLMAIFHDAYVFMVLFGVGSIFEMVTRPPITAVIRFNYAPQRRGRITGEIRKWCSLVFLGANLGGAMLLDWAQDGGSPIGIRATIVLLMLAVGVLDLASFLVFSTIRVRETDEHWRRDHKPEIARSFREAGLVVATNKRYRDYLIGCFLFGFFGLLYTAQIKGFLSDLNLSYVQIELLAHIIPCAAQFLTTGLWGGVFDRTTPNRAWTWIRIGWGLDAIILVAAPVVAGLFSGSLAVLMFLLVAGRLCRGGVMGGSWVLWWRVGVAHFAPPGGDTSRYMGILTFLNGVMRLGAGAISSVIVAYSSPAAVLLIGGMGVIFSGLYSWVLALRERTHKNIATIADFEAQFEGTGDD